MAKTRKTGEDRKAAPGATMRRGAKRGRRSRRRTVLDEEKKRAAEDGDLPKDEAGRRKIKRQYVALLGIRVEKLKGRILNRERINKTIEGVYFICVECKRVCHNVDDGLVEDPDNVRNLCGTCAKSKRKGRAA